MTRRETIAAAIANARGGRQGMPAISNVLDALPAQIRDDLLDDAAAVERALDDDALGMFRLAVDELKRAQQRLHVAGESLRATTEAISKSLASKGAQ